ncbi:nucleoporin-62 C-terminal-like protein isoform X1 [Hemicordylus capensis]|uniref:nucleoporin-62 C-terminal-like protein isoform X1 n=1 Tax=Hemicordylus capensis TaxID=884348 RepID=UPI0023039577|nr:nucleoporin-62 C-terminal-like protein isoform X1 [Hemicordylus capensis]XP_053130182.1 nucleoporin-62 C-terminal-like protein isoform X1 [Hemicordylus capensis]XP_053130183.1 nucleoporin-62 C-terminal-like protein isoform X1 [Hemicordylus capensis]
MSQFNFGGSGATGGGFNFGTPKTAASTAPTGFSFSTASGGGFSFGTPAQNPPSTQPAGLFALATPTTTTTQMSGFSFGTPATSAPAGNVFTLGGNAPKLTLGSTGTAAAPGITGGFGLGSSGGLGGSVPSSTPASQPVAPSGFVFGSTTTTQPATTGGFSFGGGGVAQTGTPNFSLGSVGNATQQPTPTGLTFGVAPAVASTPNTTAAASQPATAFSLGTQSTGSGFGLLVSAAAAAAASATSAPTATLSQGPSLSFGSKLGGTAATSTAPATTTVNSLLGLSGPSLFASIASSSAPAASTATSLSLGTPLTGMAPAVTLGFGSKVPGTLTAAAATATTTASTTPVPSTGFTLNLKPLPTTGTAATTSSVAATTTVTAPPVMTYVQLESLINKWSLELEDQEKHFLQQATQVNAWDRTLIENGEKITSLHREVEKVKLDQKRLDQELDFILSQQKELEDLLIPLEESVKEQSGTIYLQHADEEREKTYKLAENIDAQLKRMAQDLKDIIEHLNTSGGPADTSDPLQQICKILNAHMDSLQWIDQNSALLQRKVEEVTKVCESRHKEQERSFRITFD